MYSAQVPEHTWGVDIKESLPDYRNWSNADFHAALEARTPMYGSTVYSWVRQKAYLRWALAALRAHHPHADNTAHEQFTASVHDNQFKSGSPGLPYTRCHPRPCLLHES